MFVHGSTKGVNWIIQENKEFLSFFIGTISITERYKLKSSEFT